MKYSFLIRCSLNKSALCRLSSNKYELSVIRFLSQSRWDKVRKEGWGKRMEGANKAQKTGP